MERFLEQAIFKYLRAEPEDHYFLLVCIYGRILGQGVVRIMFLRRNWKENATISMTASIRSSLSLLYLHFKDGTSSQHTREQRVHCRDHVRVFQRAWSLYSSAGELCNISHGLRLLSVRQQLRDWPGQMYVWVVCWWRRTVFSSDGFCIPGSVGLGCFLDVSSSRRPDTDGNSHWLWGWRYPYNTCGKKWTLLSWFHLFLKNGWDFSWCALCGNLFLSFTGRGLRHRELHQTHSNCWPWYHIFHPAAVEGERNRNPPRTVVRNCQSNQGLSCTHPGHVQFASLPHKVDLPHHGRC